MIIEQRIKDFEKLGLGMFVHFGLYSQIGLGEWAKYSREIPDAEYEPLKDSFNPVPDWADELVATAKKMGCKYITLTTRHHDGYSLYDTCGLNDYDAPHSCGRDLVKEFVDACRKQDIIPFFYHTLLDWREPSYKENFPEYLKYLRRSIEILCTNYGEIGGFWFDGKWNKPNDDWEEDALYGLIRKYQPEAMIINNTGLNARGEAGHIELDSVTFERGRPGILNREGAPKYLASEMCQTLNGTWGYGKSTINFKSVATLIGDLCTSRRYGANLLLNVGPKGDGTLRTIDKGLLEMFSIWMDNYNEAIYAPYPTGIEIENKPNDFLLKDNDTYYLFCDNVGVSGSGNVVIWEDGNHEDKFKFDKKIKRITWLDNGKEVAFEQEADIVTVHTVPFAYGVNLIVRVAKIETE